MQEFSVPPRVEVDDGANLADLVWDGANDSGVQEPHGVYFTRARYSSGFDEARKLIVLR